MRTLWQIQAPHMTAGLISENGQVVEAAPIIRRMVGKTVAAVRIYARSRGWRLIEVETFSA